MSVGVVTGHRVIYGNMTHTGKAKISDGEMGKGESRNSDMLSASL